MMSTNIDLVDLALTQENKPYIYAFEVDLTDPDPVAFDCSELIQWDCARLGIKPRMPDGAIYQMRFCRDQGTLMSINEAIKTPGTLLFRITGSGNHVAISQGNGKTIEARGKAYGVGQFSSQGRGWTHAAKVPGLKYI